MCFSKSTEIEVLFQKLGDRWYAFWELSGEIHIQPDDDVSIRPHAQACRVSRAYFIGNSCLQTQFIR
jgi:hypothetical protein